MTMGLAETFGSSSSGMTAAAMLRLCFATKRYSESAAIAAASATGKNATTDPSKNSATSAPGFEEAPIRVDNPAVSVATMSSAQAKPDTHPIAQCAIR